MVFSFLSRERLYWVLQLSGWGLLAFISLLFADIFKVELPAYLLYGRVAASCLLGLFTTHVARLLLKRIGLLKKPLEKIWPWVLLIVLATALLYGILLLLAFETFNLYLSADASQLNVFQKVLALTADSGLFISSWLLIYFFEHYNADNRRRQVDSLKLESTVRELELKTLKAHINPHFIFNSLNSIRALVDENPERARRAITELSNLLRSSMQTEKLQLVPLQHELDVIKDYLALEKIRFEDRLQVETSIAPETLELPVPPMMLQTLVENAIKHGIGTRINGGWIKIRSYIREDQHVLEVANSGNLNGSVITAGFGLSSTQNRLQILFGDSARLDIRQPEQEVVLSSVHMPVKSYHA